MENNMPIALILTLKLITFDIDYSGDYTYLFETTINSRPAHIAYTSKELLVSKEDTRISANVVGSCSKAFGVDEEASDKHNTWVSYRAYICSAENINVSIP